MGVSKGSSIHPPKVNNPIFNQKKVVRTVFRYALFCKTKSILLGTHAKNPFALHPQGWKIEKLIYLAPAEWSFPFT